MINPQACIGHVQLQVDDLERAMRFRQKKVKPPTPFMQTVPKVKEIEPNRHIPKLKPSMPLWSKPSYHDAQRRDLTPSALSLDMQPKGCILKGQPTRKGRSRRHGIYERWIANFERRRLDALNKLKQSLEGQDDG